jgi:hypothetical protein
MIALEAKLAIEGHPDETPVKIVINGVLHDAVIYLSKYDGLIVDTDARQFQADLQERECEICRKTAVFIDSVDGKSYCEPHIPNVLE